MQASWRLLFSGHLMPGWLTTWKPIKKTSKKKWKNQPGYLNRKAGKMLLMIDLKKNIRFKLGSEDWEMPLGVLLLLIGITLLFVVGGIYVGYLFGDSQF